MGESIQFEYRQASREVLDTVIATAHRETVAFYSLEARAKDNRDTTGSSCEPVSTASTAPTSLPVVGGDVERLHAAKRALLTTLSTLLTTLRLLEAERLGWWRSKVTVRKQWEEQLLFNKITAQQVINNKTREMTMDMEAHVGKFARWGLGIQDVEGLETVPEARKDITGSAAQGLTCGQTPTAVSAQQTSHRDMTDMTTSKDVPPPEDHADVTGISVRRRSGIDQSAAEKLKKLENARKLREMIEGQVL